MHRELGGALPIQHNHSCTLILINIRTNIVYSELNCSSEIIIIMHGLLLLLLIFPYLEEPLYGFPVFKKMYLLTGLLAIKGKIGSLWLSVVVLVCSRH
jgi:hypothetical protein